MKLNGNFFGKHCVPATFCLAKKFGEIDPRQNLMKVQKTNKIAIKSELLINIDNCFCTYSFLSTLNEKLVQVPKKIFYFAVHRLGTTDKNNEKIQIQNSTLLKATNIW